MCDPDFAEQQRAWAEEELWNIFLGYVNFVQCNCIIRDKRIKLQTILAVSQPSDKNDRTIIIVTPIPTEEEHIEAIYDSLMRQWRS